MTNDLASQLQQAADQYPPHTIAIAPVEKAGVRRKRRSTIAAATGGTILLLLVITGFGTLRSSIPDSIAPANTQLAPKQLPEILEGIDELQPMTASPYGAFDELEPSLQAELLVDVGAEDREDVVNIDFPAVITFAGSQRTIIRSTIAGGSGRGDTELQCFSVEKKLGTCSERLPSLHVVGGFVFFTGDEDAVALVSRTYRGKTVGVELINGFGVLVPTSYGVGHSFRVQYNDGSIERIWPGPELLRDVDYIEVLFASPYEKFESLSAPDQARLASAAGAGSIGDLISINLPVGILGVGRPNMLIQSTVISRYEDAAVTVECVGFEKSIGRICLEHLPSVVQLPGVTVVSAEGLIAATARVGPGTVVGAEAKNGVAIIGQYLAPMGEIKGEFSDGSIRILHPGDVSYENWTASPAVVCFTEHQSRTGEVRTGLWSRSLFSPPRETHETNFETLSFDLIAFPDLWVLPSLERPGPFADDEFPTLTIRLYKPRPSNTDSSRIIPVRDTPLEILRGRLVDTSNTAMFSFEHPITGSALSIECTYGVTG